MTRHYLIRFSILLVSVACLSGASVSLATTYNFAQDNDANGVWTENNRWGAGAAFPNAIDDVATIGEPATTAPDAANTVYKLTLNNQTITIGNLTVNNAVPPTDFITQIGDDTLTDGKLVFQSSSGSAQFNELLVTSGGLANRTRIFSPVELQSDLDITQDHNLNRNTATEILGKINGSAARTISKKGFGNLQLAYDGTFNTGEGFFGTYHIYEGAIRLIGASSLKNAAGVIVEDHGQLQIGNNVANVSLGSPTAVLTLNGLGKGASGMVNNEGALRWQLNAGIDSVFANPVNMPTDTRIRVNVAGTSGALTSVVSGAGKLTVDSGGIFILSGANTYAGGTIVSGNGRLIINNTSGSGVGSGDVTMSGGSTVLGGKGFIGTAGDPSNVAITNSIVSPGDANLADDTAGNPQPSQPGALTVFGDLSLTGTIKWNVDLTDSVYDQVITTGAVALGVQGTLNLPTATYVPNSIHPFTLIDNQGANPITGSFSNYAEGASVLFGTHEYKLSYVGGTGNDLVLNPVVVGVPGDYNGNGVVDGADYVLWRHGGPLQNEVDTPNVVNNQDYVEWRARFGNTSGSGSGALSGSTSVPEPAAALLLTVALSAAVAISRQR